MKTTGFLITLILMILVDVPVFSQTPIGNPADNEASSNVVTDNAGNTYIGGVQNKKGLIVKQNAAHVTLWSKTLAFTSDPNSEVVLSFLDILADTVFGCGKIEQSNQSQGTFFFKMNAQTGAMYWSKFESGAGRYFSCMRYSKGKYYLIGGIVLPTHSSGNIQTVSSHMGQGLWRLDDMFGPYINLVPLTTSVSATRFFSATEMVNGKMYVLGASESYGSVNSVRLPILVGVDEAGSFFLQGNIVQTAVLPSTNQYDGGSIVLDQNKNLVMQLYGMVGSSTTPRGILLKCDTLGTLIFSKYYDIPSNSSLSMWSLNETPTSYVIFGDVHAATNGLYALKVAKNGTFQKCVRITKPNTTYENGWSNDLSWGNSSYRNGLHHFSTTEYNGVSLHSDINQIILDGNLNLTADDCSEAEEIFPTMMDVSTTIAGSSFQYALYYIINGAIPPGFEFWDPFTIADESFAVPCTGLSLNMTQNTGCSQLTITANTTGFSTPTFHWSNGTTTTTNSITVNTTDTIFLHVTDIRCCELRDTIVPVLSSSLLAMSLPADTNLCIEPGNSYTLAPTVSGAVGTVQYLWNTNVTGPSLSITASGTYWVDVTDDCLTKRDSIVLVVNSLPVIGNAVDITACEDDFPVVLNPTVSPGATVLWDDGTPIAQRIVNGPGSYMLSATNVCGTTNKTLAVSQTNLPTVQLISSIDTCVQNGGSVLLTPILTGVTSTLWSNGAAGNQLVVSTSGIYTVYGSNVCGIDSAVCSVGIHYFPELDLPARLDTCFEIGVGFSYTANGSGGSYQWSWGSQTATEWISQEGIYTCTLSNQCGTIADTMSVHRVLPPDLYFPEDSIRDCLHQLAVSELHIETNYGLEILAPYHGVVGTTLTETGWYTIHAFNGCWHKWDSIYADLQNEANFYLPNSFTPNGDLNNDRFEFKGENMEVRDVRIFNRWGEEIFMENGNFSGWDGTYRGENCPVGIYAVHVIYEDCFGLPTEFNGHVNLVR